MKNADFWGAAPCGSLYSDVSEERVTSILRIEKIRVLGIPLEVTASYCLRCS
jgi:hypothetical protein